MREKERQLERRETETERENKLSNYYFTSSNDYFLCYQSQEKLPGEWTMREERIGDHYATQENTACNPCNLIRSGEFESQ